MTARRLWIAAVISGLIAFAASYTFGTIPGIASCVPTGGLSPIIAFEFVRSPADVAALFGAEPCRSVHAAAQGKALLIDALWFIPAYAAFLALAALATGVSWRRWIVAVILAAAIADQVEGAILWSILSNLPGTEGQTNVLPIAVHTKFALLALGTAGVGWALNWRDQLWRRLPGLLIAAAGVYALLQLVLGHIAAMMLGFTIGWFAVLAVAILAAVWPSLFAARDGSPPAPERPAA